MSPMGTWAVLFFTGKYPAKNNITRNKNLSIDYPVTPIYSANNSVDSFTLGRPAAIQVGVDALRDGQVYDYTIVSGKKYERGSGIYHDDTKTISRTNITSSNNNQPERFDSGVLINISLNGLPVSESIKVLDELGNHSQDAISQRCVTDELSRRIYNQDPTSKKYQTPSKALFFSDTGKVIAESADGNEKTLADENFVSKAIADIGGGTGKTFLTTDLSNLDLPSFQKQPLKYDQIVNALSYVPLKDADLLYLLKTNMSNVDLNAFQKLPLLDDQIITALGYKPAKFIDADNLADNKLSNVLTDDFKAKFKDVYADDPALKSDLKDINTKLDSVPSTDSISNIDVSSDGNSISVKDKKGASHTIGGVSDGLAKNDLSNVDDKFVNNKVKGFIANTTNDDLAASGVWRKWQLPYFISGADNDGSWVGLFVRAQVANNGVSGDKKLLQIPTKDQVSKMIDQGGGNNAGGQASSTSISGFDNTGGRYAQSINQIVANADAPHFSGSVGVRVIPARKGATPIDLVTFDWLKDQGYVTGLHGSDKSVQNIYAHNTGTGTTARADENITVNYTNFGKNKVEVELATQLWIQKYYALKADIPSLTQDLKAASQTAAPSQKAVVDGIFATVKSSSNGRIGQFYTNPLSFADNSSATDRFCIEFAQDQATGGTLPFKAELASKKFTEATYIKSKGAIAGGMDMSSAVSGKYNSPKDGPYQSVINMGAVRGIQDTYNKGYTVQVSYNGWSGENVDPISLTSRDEFLAEIKKLQDRVAALENK